MTQQLGQRDITSFLEFAEPPLPELSFIPVSEFLHKDKHSTKHNNGCACKQLGVAYVFLENLLSDGNIGRLDFSECCWHCKLAHKTVETREVGPVEIYSCSIHYDNWIRAFIDEINEVTVHELIHACGLVINERQVERATATLTPHWEPCRKFVELKEVPP